MNPAIGTRAEEMARGRLVKRRNAFTAALSGSLLIAFSLRFLPPAPSHSREEALIRLGVGLAAGLIYANGFEYVLHRFVLHKGEGFLDMRHARHHDTAGAAEEARYVTFARSPWVAVLVFALNAIPVFILEYIVPSGIAAGVFLGFTLYFISYEEIHWRIHFGPLPRWLNFARRHHMLHHGGFAGRYNVFLPLFDWIFQRSAWNKDMRTERR